MPAHHGPLIGVDLIYPDIVAVHQNISEEEAAPKSIIFHAHIPLQLINIALLEVNIEGVSKLVFCFGDFCPNAPILNIPLLV